MLKYKITLQNRNVLKLPSTSVNHLRQPSLQQRYRLSPSLKKNKSGKLPVIHPIPTKNTAEEYYPISTIMTQRSNDLNQKNFKEKNAQASSEITKNKLFAAELQQKMKNIINLNEKIGSEYYFNQNDNFQDNILKNKQILKIQREKSMKINDYGHLPQIIIQNNSTESKALSKVKSKSLLPTRDHKSKLKQIKQTTKQKLEIKNYSKLTDKPSSPKKDQKLSLNLANQPKKTNYGKLQTKLYEFKKNNPNKSIHFQHKIQTESAEVEDSFNSDNLFDNIHNFLTNPQRTQSEFMKKAKVSINNSHRKLILQQKIKEIDRKISSLANKSQSKREIESKRQIESRRQKIQEVGIPQNQNHDYGVSCWRRAQIYCQGSQNKQIALRESNFQRQIHYLGKLEQRNAQSLQKFIANQRILSDLKTLSEHKKKERLERQFFAK